MPFRDLVSPHAQRQARRRAISLGEIEDTYVDPDDVRQSGHDVAREIRGRSFPSGRVEIVVDTIDGRVVSTWRRQSDQ
jgi:hypothetical protein